MWFALGEERMVDAAKVIVKRAAGQGVHVQLEMYEAMPHNWPMLFPTWWQSDFCMERWARACRDCVEDKSTSSSVEYVGVNKETTQQDVGGLIAFTPEEALTKMREKQATLKPWFPTKGIEKL